MNHDDSEGFIATAGSAADERSEAFRQALFRAEERVWEKLPTSRFVRSVTAQTLLAGIEMLYNAVLPLWVIIVLASNGSGTPLPAFRLIG